MPEADDAIIEIEVGLQSKSKSEIDSYLAKVEKIKENLNDIKNLTGDDEITENSRIKQSKTSGDDVFKKIKDDELGEINEDEKDVLEALRNEINAELDEIKEETEKLKESMPKDDKKKIDDALATLTDKEISDLRSLLQNPTSYFEGGMMNVLKELGPNAPLMLTIVGIITGSAVLYIEILKALSQKGGPFNRDWRRLIGQEVEIGLSRELQKRKELGIDQVILPQTRGFVPNNPIATYNSLYLVNESRIARIGLDDKAAGVIIG